MENHQSNKTSTKDFGEVLKSVYAYVDWTKPSAKDLQNIKY